MTGDIGNKLKTLRKGRGLTQLQAATKMELSRATISNHEVGRRTPSLNELKRYASLYGTSLSFFGVETKDESFELLSRAKSIFTNDEIDKAEKERLYKSIMKMYLEI